MRNIFAPDFFFRDIYQITPEFLCGLGVRGLIMDIDNTIVTYDDPEPTGPVSEWFEKIDGAGIKIAFVSNNGEARVRLFNEKTGYFASWKSKKPFPHKLRAAMRMMGTDKSSTMMVGDQIFTDIAAGKLAGVRTVLVEPIKDITTRFNLFKRRMERLVLGNIRDKK